MQVAVAWCAYTSNLCLVSAVDYFYGVFLECHLGLNDCVKRDGLSDVLEARIAYAGGCLQPGKYRKFRLGREATSMVRHRGRFDLPMVYGRGQESSSTKGGLLRSCVADANARLRFTL